MYVCLCHGFTDRQVRALPEAACGSTSSVYRALGVRPRCGKCVPMVKALVRAASDAVADGQLAEASLPA